MGAVHVGCNDPTGPNGEPSDPNIYQEIGDWYLQIHADRMPFMKNTVYDSGRKYI